MEISKNKSLIEYLSIKLCLKSLEFSFSYSVLCLLIWFWAFWLSIFSTLHGIYDVIFHLSYFLLWFSFTLSISFYFFYSLCALLTVVWMIPHRDMRTHKMFYQFNFFPFTFYLNSFFLLNSWYNIWHFIRRWREWYEYWIFY